MRRLLPLLCLAALPLAAAPAAAQGTLHLAWNDCGAYGQTLRTFACNTNSGNHALVVSFVAPLALEEMVGFEGTIRVLTDSATLPSWWKYYESGSCRLSSLASSMDFSAGPYSCADYWQNLGVTGVAYHAGIYGPNTGRLRLIAAIAPNYVSHLDAGVEVYAMRVMIGNQKTVGSGSCPGCDVAAVLGITDGKLVQPAGVGDYVLTPTDERWYASWQCPASVGTDGPPIFHCTVPALPRSWGRIKALYR